MYRGELLKVSKPARYIGGELNSVYKERNGKTLDFCLIFPDIYEIGSSHIGFRLLYENVNLSPSVYCQRFFAPWPDALEVLGEKAFVSLERGDSLKSFDVLGFSLHYEMSYTTALAILKNSSIPLRSSLRGEDMPLIMAGGSCVFNPVPLLPFIDVFYIGEGDEGLRIVLEGIDGLKRKDASKRDLLEYLNRFSFLYVPAVNRNKRVKRDIFLGFSQSEGSSRPIVPVMPPVQDRVSVEIARGCGAGCRFCQAGVIYRPVRERPVNLIVNEARRQLLASGHLEASLLSLSTGDYSRLEPLVKVMNAELSPMGVSLSTPSLRADSVSEALFEEIYKVRRSGFTIAPEAGTERMRSVINKNLTEIDILRAVRVAASNGCAGVKLYFMIGLPYETDEDILGIAKLASKIKNAASEVKKGGFDISVSVSHFVPKPHTPFQRLGQVPKNELERRMYLLKDELKRRRFKFKFHDTRTSAVEALLSRGGEEIARVLERGAEDGFYLDAWDDFFDFNRWALLCEDCGVNLEEYAARTYNKGEDMPWSNIDTGVTEEFYDKELEKAALAAATPDCRKSSCSACGVCDFKFIAPRKAPVPQILPPKAVAEERAYEIYELTYSKTERAGFLSALETGRIFSHALRAAGVRLKFSQGFNPLPRIVLWLPLPVGIEGLEEKVLFESSPIEKNEFLHILHSKLPEGFRPFRVEKARSMKTGSDFISWYHLEGAARAELEKAISQNDAFYEKEKKSGKRQTVCLADFMTSYEDGVLTLKAGASGGFNLLEFFKKRDMGAETLEIVRLSVKTL